MKLYTFAVSVDTAEAEIPQKIWIFPEMSKWKIDQMSYLELVEVI